MMRKPIGQELIEELKKLGFETSKNGEAEIEEVNKATKEEKLGHMLKFITNELREQKKIVPLAAKEISELSEIARIPKEEITVEKAVGIYEDLLHEKKLNKIKSGKSEASLDESLKEEEEMNKILQQELENLRKTEALFIKKEEETREAAKGLETSSSIIGEQQKACLNISKVAERYIVEKMTTNCKGITDAVELIEKQKENSEGNSLIKEYLPTAIVSSVVMRYQAFISKLKAAFKSFSDKLEIASKGEASEDAKETEKILNSLLVDMVEVREGTINATMYQKRIEATETAIDLAIQKEGECEEKFDTKEEEKIIEKLHKEVKANATNSCEWEIHTSYSKYAEKISGNELISSLGPFLMKLEGILKKQLSLATLLLSTLHTEKDFTQKIFGALTEINSRMEDLLKLFVDNIGFLSPPIPDELEYKLSLDDRDELLQGIKRIALVGLDMQDSEEKKQPDSLNTLYEQIAKLNNEIGATIKGTGKKAIGEQIKQKEKIEEALIISSLEEISEEGGNIENKFVHDKLCQLIEKKEELAKGLRSASENYFRAKKMIFKDPKTGFTINDIFIDFMLCQCDNIESRIQELKAESKLKKSSSL